MSESEAEHQRGNVRKKTRSPPKKAKVEQSVPKKKKLKTDAEKPRKRPSICGLARRN